MFNGMFSITPFFDQPNDTPASGLSPGNTGVKGGNVEQVIEIKHKGEVRKFDLSKPEDLKIVSDYASKGHAFEKNQTELNKYKTQVESWNELIVSAKTNDEAFNKLKGFIELETGRKLTDSQVKSEIKKIEKELDDDDPYMKRITKLEQLYEEDKKTREEENIKNQAEKLVDNLDSMSKNKDKYPFFDREEVFQEARKLNLYDFDLVYNILYREKILQAEREKVIDEQKKMQRKRDGVFGETSPSPAGTSIANETSRIRSINKLGEEILARMKKEGKSFLS